MGYRCAVLCSRRHDLAPLLRDALHLSRAQLGALTALFLTGAITAALLAGWLAKSGLATWVAYRCMTRYARSYTRMVTLVDGLGFVPSFLIPHPFPGRC